jgi:hypothetical protein
VSKALGNAFRKTSRLCSVTAGKIDHDACRKFDDYVVGRFQLDYVDVNCVGLWREQYGNIGEAKTA